MVELKNLPAVAEAVAEREQVLALPATSGASVMQTLSALRTGLEQAVGQMGADDISLEIDAAAGRLHVRFRAYKHRKS
jgi:hypothetical protein